MSHLVPADIGSRMYSRQGSREKCSQTESHNHRCLWWLDQLNKQQSGYLTGELIAVTGESLYVLTHSSPREISKEDIISARLVVYNTNTSEYVLWAILGSLSTISNGFYFVFTFPAWLLAGIPTSIGESKRNNYLDYPANSLEEMIKYSRFPQGLPAGIELSSLRPRL
jgi:hypothetical protein